MFKKMLKLTPLFLLIYGVISLSIAEDKLDPSFDPPGGIPVEKTPQFIVMGFDDNCYTDGMKWLLDFIEGKENPAGLDNDATFDGQPIKMSFFFIGDAIEGNDELLKQWQRAVAAGHEVANHTKTHETTSALSVSQWESELSGCTDILVDKLKVNESEIVGFRTPYLDYGRSTFDALKNLGFLYECTIAHQPDIYTKRHIWPYTLHNGFHALTVIGDATSWKYPGMWEIPVYQMSCDMTGYPSYAGFDSTILLQAIGKQWPSMLKVNLDFRLADGGNRAPYTIGVHTDTYSPSNPDAATSYDHVLICSERQKSIEEFIDYALTKPDVRFVTAQQLIQWLNKPIALDDIVTSVQNITNGKSLVNNTFVVSGNTLRFAKPVSSTLSISLFSVNGKKVMRDFTKNITSHSVELPLNDISRGVYYLQVKNNNLIVGRQILVQ